MTLVDPLNDTSCPRVPMPWPGAVWPARVRSPGMDMDAFEFHVPADVEYDGAVPVTHGLAKGAWAGVVQVGDVDDLASAPARWRLRRSPQRREKPGDRRGGAW